MSGSRSPLSVETAMLELCKEFSWTYHDYMQNPHWFNQGMWIILMETRKAAVRESKHSR